MPKRLPPNNRPWPENMAFDFSISPSLSPTDAEAFIRSLPTSNRNKRFLLLRYQKGCTYNEIADEYGITPSGVRLAVKTMWEKFGRSTAAPAPAVPVPTAATPPVTDLAPQSAATSPTAPVTTQAAFAAAPPTAPAPPMVEEKERSQRPLSLNLAAVRRFLGLSAEEFTRPISIEDGEALITRLETGFSKASQPFLSLICEAWGINQQYLLTGTGPMFEESSDYCSSLVRLLKRYLSVATFDPHGNQYWKGSLVDDLSSLIDVGRLSGAEICRVVRVLYDYLDVEEFERVLERMGT